MQDGELWNMGGHLILRGSYEHVVHEGGMPCLLRDQSNWHPELWVGPTEGIFDEQVLCMV